MRLRRILPFWTSGPPAIYVRTYLPGGGPNRRQFGFSLMALSVLAIYGLGTYEFGTNELGVL